MQRASLVPKGAQTPLKLHADKMRRLRVELDALQLQTQCTCAGKIVTRGQTPQKIDSRIVVDIDMFVAAARRVLGIPRECPKARSRAEAIADAPSIQS